MAVDSGTYTDADLAMRRRLAEALIKGSQDASPISSHWQGANRLLQAVMGNYQARQIADEQKASGIAAGKAMADALLGPGTLQQTAAAAMATPPIAPTATPDPRGGSGDFLDFVKKQEGFRPNAYGDYKQTSIGYGTKALPGETSITQEEAEKRLRTEVGQSRQLVQAWARDAGITLSPKREDALTDLTFNAGTTWMNSGLGQAAKSGDWQGAQKSFLQYINAGGKPLPGLLARRHAASGWLMDDAIPVDPMAEGGLPVSPGAPQAAAGGPASSAAPLGAPQPHVPQQGVMGDQRLRAMLQSPHPQVRQMGIALATEAAKRQMAGRDVSFGVVGKDEYGKETYGWIDKTGRTITPVGGLPGAPAAAPAPGAPAAAGALAPAPAAIEQPPAGVDPKEWRKIQTKRLASEAADKDRKTAAASIVTDDIDRALKLEQEATLPASGPLAALTQHIPGTNAYDVKSLLTTVKANAGFDRLQAMRAASPTGGALGAVSNKENELLQAAIGNLEQSQSQEQFRRNLKRVKNVYLDIIHGKGKGPEREEIEESGEGGWREIGGVKIREKR